MNCVSNPTILDKCQDGDTPGASQRPMPVTFFPPREIANVPFYVRPPPRPHTPSAHCLQASEIFSLLQNSVL